MKLKEIGNRINAYLKRFEANKEINATDPKYGTRPYHYPHAVANGRYVAVQYVTYHGVIHLTKNEAVEYLAWLDAGNVGEHWRVPKTAALTTASSMATGVVKLAK